MRFILILRQSKLPRIEVDKEWEGVRVSPEFSTLRYNNATKTSDLDFATGGGMLYHLGSALTYGSTDRDCCLAVNMIPPTWDVPSDVLKQSIARLDGSLSLLWPLFQTLC